MPVEWDTEDFVVRSRKASLRALDSAADVLRAEIIRLILDTPKTGRFYRRRGVTHQASAPGEPPASDTGALLRGVTVAVDTEQLVLRVTNDVGYALALEFGTPWVQPRPFMRVALENKREEITEILQSELNAEFGP